MEKNLDNPLVGTEGWVKLEANSRGIIKKEIVRKSPIPGKNIKTNLILVPNKLVLQWKNYFKLILK